jgi:hypothetical protein
MPKQKLKLPDHEYRARLGRLKQLGVSIGPTTARSPEPDRLIVEQIDREYARLFELPSGAVAVLVLAKMTVLTSGLLVTDLEMILPWDDCMLDLEDPEGSQFHKDVIDSLPFSAPVLNHQLKSGIALRPCTLDGAILANSCWGVVPPQYHDETPLTVKLFLGDERHNEICVDFEVRLDRSLKRNYERKQARRREGRRLTGRSGGLYGPDLVPLGDQKNVGPKYAIKPQRDNCVNDAKPQKPN